VQPFTLADQTSGAPNRAIRRPPAASIDALRQLPLFAHAPEPEIALTQQLGACIRIDPARCITTRGREAILIIEGIVFIAYDRDALAIARPGAIISTGLYSRAAWRSAKLFTLTEASVLVLTGTEVTHLLDETHVVASHMRAQTSHDCRTS
jgi:hypothetical protein